MALVATWHRMPFESKTWASSKVGNVSGLRESLDEGEDDDDDEDKNAVEEFLESLDDECPRQHSGSFEGPALSGVILAAETGFNWDSLPASAGERQRWTLLLAHICVLYVLVPYRSRHSSQRVWPPQAAARAFPLAAADCTCHQLFGGCAALAVTARVVLEVVPATNKALNLQAQLRCLWSAGGMPDSAIASFSKMLPSGRPDEAATAAYLRQREQEGSLGQRGRFTLDSSQILSIATAVLNPLALLHGPPGTGVLCWTSPWQSQP